VKIPEIRVKDSAAAEEAVLKPPQSKRCRVHP